MSESTNDTTNTTSAPEVDTTAVPPESIPAEATPDTGAEREQGGAASDEDELAARRAAVLAGDYSAWSADLSLSEPVTPSEPAEQKPSPAAVEAVQRIARAHGTPAAIGRSVVFHGDGYPVRGVIIGAEGNSLAMRIEGGMECLVPPDIQIQYLDTQGRVIWASPDLPDQEQPQQPQAEEPAAEQATGQADPDQAAEQTDPDHVAEAADQDQAGQAAQGDEAPATAPQPEGVEDAQDAGQESGLTDEPRDTDPDGETVDRPRDQEPTVQPDGEPADQPQGAERGAETADQVVDRADHEAEDAGSEQEEPQASEPGAESPEAR